MFTYLNEQWDTQKVRHRLDNDLSCETAQATAEPLNQIPNSGVHHHHNNQKTPLQISRMPPRGWYNSLGNYRLNKLSLGYL